MKSDEDDHYKPIRTGNAFTTNYIEYESSSNKDKSLSVKEYFNKIRSYLCDMINDYKTQGEWKIELTTEINFMSSKDSNETGTMHK